MDSGMGDKLKGMKDKVVGKIKEEYGDLVDDPEKNSKENSNKHAVKQSKKGEIKEDISDKVDDLADKAK